MTAKFTCPTCRKALKAAPEVIGKRVKCPGCGTAFTASAEEDIPVLEAVAAGEPPDAALDVPGQFWCVKAHQPSTKSIAFSYDGKWVISAGGSSIGVSEAATGRSVRRIQAPRAIQACAVSPAEPVAATAGGPKKGECTITLWDLRTGGELRTCAGHEAAIADLDFAPTGKALASASEDGTVRVWSVGSGKEIRQFRVGGGGFLG